MPLPLRAHSLTHPGLHHPRNEDTFTVLPTNEGGLLLVVCDGMGGMGRGDEASKLAADVISAEMSRSEGVPADRMRMSLRIADQRVREELCEDGGELPGTTAVMVYVMDGAAHVAWVGDSRAYLIRDGQVVFRTRDHKLVEELVDAGQLTPEEARDSALAHVVTRALGGRSPSEPAVHPATLGYPWKLLHNDRIMLCSDGVCDLLEDDEIASLVEGASPAEAASRLLEASLMRGGHDNITCIVGVWDGASWVDDEATPVIAGQRQVGPILDGETMDADTADGPEDVIPMDDAADPAGRVTEEIDLRSLREQADLAEFASPEDEDIADQPTAEVERPITPSSVGSREHAPIVVDAATRTWVVVGAGLLVLAALVAVGSLI
jgi:protein phosphatase